MKSFVYIALVVFLGTVAVQGYGPRIQRKKYVGPQKSHWSDTRPSHVSHRGPPQRQHHDGPHQRPHHHGPRQRPQHRPHDFGPPNQRGNWDNSRVWDDRSDSRYRGGDRGSYDSYESDRSNGSNDYSRERDSSDRYTSSYEDYGDWYDQHHWKNYWERRHNKELPKIPRSIPTTPKPIQTTPQPILTTHRIPLNPTLPPHPAYTRFTSNPTGTTAAWTNLTTAQIKIFSSVPSPPTTTRSRPTEQPTPPTVDTTHLENTKTVPETRSFIPLPTTNPNLGVETTTVEEEFPTISPEIEACIDLCLSTPEYNPVCGSDGVTYNNEGKLFCAGSCGVNVTLVRRSVCPPPNWDYDDDGSEPPSPITTSTTPSRARTTSLSDFQRCMRLCQITALFTPICGTDLVTYMNIDRLKCAQSCGKVVEVLCEKPCAACGFNPVTPKTTTLRPSTTLQDGSSTQEPGIQDCINGCPVTTEYNPVCGSNHVTYRNPSQFVCAQLCGVGVAVSRLGPCGPNMTSSTTTEAPTSTLPSDHVLRCILGCPVTTEYDPVCGSNDLTYNNLGNLYCSIYCGVEVEFKHKSRCVNEFDLGPDETDEPSKTTQGNKDHVTITPLFTSTTTATTTLKSTSTSNTGPNSSSTLGFKIPDDVFYEIFPNTTTETTTKPKSPDEDENIDLDARFNSETDTDKDKDTGRGHYTKIIFPD